MTGQGIAQIVVYAVVLIALAYPLGLYMARVYAPALPRPLAVRARARLLPARAHRPRSASRTGRATRRRCSSSASSSSASLYAIQRLQGHLFLNPDHLQGVPSHIALNTTASFVTNTNWQYYGGEYTMSYLTQMAGLAVQHFVSAAVGMAVLVAVSAASRAGRATGARQLLGRPLPLARLHPAAALARSSAVILLSQGVPQTFAGHATATTLEGAAQTIARGPVALQIAIKQLGTNGGGFYNSNSAVPFENPNGLTNFLEVLSILLIPAAQVFMFGKMVLARRHAWMVFAAMFAIFAIGVAVALPVRAARLAGAARLRRQHHAGRRPERRQHVRQGGPLRHRQHGALGDRDDRRLERLGQRRPRRAAPRTAAPCRS